MRHLRALLTKIFYIGYDIIFWLIDRFGEFTTYVGLLIVGLCLFLFFPEDLLKGVLMFGMVFAGVIFINHKKNPHG